MAINSSIHSSINKAPFEVLYGENIPLPVHSLLSRKSFINHVYTFASKMKELVAKVKSLMHNA